MRKRIRGRKQSNAAGYAVGVDGFEVFLRDLCLLLGGPDGVRAFDVQNARIPNIERPDPMEGLLVGRNVESRKGGNRAAGIWNSGFRAKVVQSLVTEDVEGQSEGTEAGRRKYSVASEGRTRRGQGVRCSKCPDSEH